MIPACDHTGTPRHFHSSITSGSACRMSARMRASVSPRQSFNSLILPSMSRDGELALPACVEPLFVFFLAVFTYDHLRVRHCRRLDFSFEHGPFRKPDSTFRDHALLPVVVRLIPLVGPRLEYALELGVVRIPGLDRLDVDTRRHRRLRHGGE